MINAANLTLFFDTLKKTSQNLPSKGTTFSHGNNYIDGGDGNDTIFIKGNENTVIGGSGDDSMFVYGNNNSIEGQSGADSILLGGTENSVLGGTENDNIYVEGDKNLIHGNEGDDSIYFNGSSNDIFGDAGTDSIVDLTSTTLSMPQSIILTTSSYTSTTSTNSTSSTTPTTTSTNSTSSTTPTTTSTSSTNSIIAIAAILQSDPFQQFIENYIAPAATARNSFGFAYNNSTYEFVEFDQTPDKNGRSQWVADYLGGFGAEVYPNAYNSYSNTPTSVNRTYMDLSQYDTNKDYHLTGSELDNLLLLKDGKTIVSAKTLGLTDIEYWNPNRITSSTSYSQKTPELNPNYNADIIVNGQIVHANTITAPSASSQPSVSSTPLPLPSDSFLEFLNNYIPASAKDRNQFGFEYNTSTYEFIEFDQGADKNGKTQWVADYLGGFGAEVYPNAYNSYSNTPTSVNRTYMDLSQYDTNKDYHLTGSELGNLLLLKDGKTIVSAKTLGLTDIEYWNPNRITSSTYYSQKTPETNPNYNADVVVNGQIIRTKDLK
ncbi:MAG: calcium-binding protein [bacterium]